MIAFLVHLVENRRLAIATAASLAIIAGSAAPWAHVPQGVLGTMTELGLDADGKITLLLGVLALGLVAAHAFLGHRDLLVGAALAAAGSAAYAVVYAADVRRASAAVTARLLQTSPDAVSVRFEASTGIGVWTVIAGGVALAAVCVALIVKPSAARPEGNDAAMSTPIAASLPHGRGAESRGKRATTRRATTPRKTGSRVPSASRGKPR